ncbi:MAG: folylpolyglutamate synthase/dihydrofolate synthase family protein [Candidatus Omnitrophota bacterium]|nr:folylpolyglutamate synthase/dihydrofolate synthase family protein [Candidatus Omnitrophota bacterium]
MTYQDALKYLDSLVNYEKASNFDYKKSLKLERMQSFSARCGDPHKNIKAIHVAGTKGKGSVSSFINSILMEAGYGVGLYTSPHLVSFRERIRINGVPISEEDMARLMTKMMPHIETMEREDERPTYFETCTMIAFLYFKENNVDFIVLETGMGGRLDSTNIVNPLISVITPISYDHVRHLGTALEDIAFEKCGIIKNNSVVVSSSQSPDALTVIKRVTSEKNAKFYLAGKDSFCKKIYSDLDKQTFSLITRCGEYPHLDIKLLGDFQIENASTAVLAIEGLRHYDIFIDKSAVSAGLLNARWPGRFEILRKKPFIIVDGAQNGQSALMLRKAVRYTLKYRKLLLILGIMSDKDVENICKELSSIADYVITTKSRSDRAASPEFLRERMLHYKNIDVVTAVSVCEALDKALAVAGKDDAILVTGSLYVAGEAMEVLSK